MYICFKVLFITSQRLMVLLDTHNKQRDDFVPAGCCPPLSTIHTHEMGASDDGTE